MTRDEHIRRELERLFREWSVRTAPIGAAIFLLIAPLDFISVPDLAPRFLAYRAATAAGLLLVWRMAARTRTPLALRAWVLTGVLLGAIAIEVMILSFGGYHSAYGDGMILLAVTVLGFIPASVGFHVLAAVIIYLVFLVPLLLWGEAVSPRIFFTQNYLFLAILTVAIFMRHLHRRSMKREIGLAFDLFLKERELESQVAERTAALVNASNEWQAAFDSTDDLMLLIDSEGRIVKANLAAALFSRTAPHNLQGATAAAWLHQAGLDDGQRPLETVHSAGTRAATEVRHDISGRWFLATAEPIPRGRALAGGTVLSLRDITDFKIMEQAVTEARDDWEETFNNIREAITIHDSDSRILRANAAARRLLGTGESPIEGRACYELFHGLGSAIVGCPSCESSRTGQPTTVDFAEPHLERYLEVTTLPRIAGGVIHVAHDISERKAAMDELTHATERLQVILGSAPFGIFIVGDEFRIEFANPAMVAISGYPREGFVGAFLGNFPGLVELGLASHVQGALEGVSFRLGPAGYRDRGNRCIVGRFTGIPIEQNGQRKAVVFVEDLTDLTAAEQERHRLNALLLQAQKLESIGTLASGIAHDFNNILLAVIGLTDAAAERLPPDHFARPELEEVINAAERGSELVQQLLAFGRKQELRVRPIDLRRLVEEIRAMLVRVIPKTITVDIHGDSALPPVVADPVQISQVLMNFAVNARDAMPAGGTLSIGMQVVRVADDDPAHPGVAPGDYALLLVRDTGSGMSPEVLARIFDPFFTTKEPGLGTGLGLATVHGIVSQHGGAVRVESEPGKGATFFVYLPAVPGAGAAEALPPPRGTETILLVEDDALIRQVIDRTLADLGYRVLVAADGEEALCLLEQDDAQPDILLCDIVLPGIGARQVAAVARARVSRARILFMSAHPESQLAQSGLLGSGNLLVAKSLGPEEIARRVRSVLDETVLE